MSILGFPSRPNERSLLSARQQQVLDAFEELIKREGLRHLTVASIADVLHCSRRTLYELAASKDDLVTLAVSRLFESNLRALRESAAGARTASEALTRGLIRAGSELGSWSADFGADLAHTPRCRDLLSAYNANTLDMVRDVIEQGVSTGEFAAVLDPDLAARAFMGAITATQAVELLPEGSTSMAASAHQAFAILLAGLRHADVTLPGHDRSDGRRRPTSTEGT